MTYREGRTAVHSNENVLDFIRPAAPTAGASALELVYQAAEVFSGIENNAREIEARAQAMCKTAAERVRLADQRAESAEYSLREVVAEAGLKLSEASRALTQVELRIKTTEERAAAAEARAMAAEAELRKAKRSLALVEDAIRRRLLCAGPETARKLYDVA